MNKLLKTLSVGAVFVSASSMVLASTGEGVFPPDSRPHATVVDNTSTSHLKYRELAGPGLLPPLRDTQVASVYWGHQGQKRKGH